jgi:Flp pilus assembly protein CpaB
VEITGKRYAGKNWRELLSTRRGTLIVAAVCAVIAGLVIIVAMQHYRASVNAQGKPETVLVATQLIQKGTTGEAVARGGFFHATQILAKQVTAGAIADTAALSGKVATVNIYPGEQLTLADFSASSDLSTQLGPDNRAISIPLEMGPGLVGDVQNGDHVDIYGTFEVTSTANSQTVPITKLLVSDATVLKAGGIASGGALGGSSSNASQTSDIVVEVSINQAAELAFASTQGSIWMTLRSANAASPSASQLVSIDSILFGSKAIPTGVKP